MDVSDEQWLNHREEVPLVAARRGWSRRALLGGTAVAGMGALGLAGARALPQQLPSLDAGPGTEPDREQHASCVDAASLVPSARVGRASLVYEPTGKATTLRFDAGFLAQLNRWKADFDATSRYGGASQVWSYGAWVTKDDCHSWHANGRAFDISRLRSGNTLLVSARTDLWDAAPAAQQARLRRRYWTLAASLHLHFAYVLTHHFDAEHRNHLHVDNGISGSAMSTFSRQSRVQNQAVQAICQEIWGRPGEVSGEWSDTSSQAGPVLDALGVTDLRRQATWQAFLRASVRRG